MRVNNISPFCTWNFSSSHLQLRRFFCTTKSPLNSALFPPETWILWCQFNSSVSPLHCCFLFIGRFWVLRSVRIPRWFTNVWVVVIYCSRALFKSTLLFDERPGPEGLLIRHTEVSLPIGRSLFYTVHNAKPATSCVSIEVMLKPVNNIIPRQFTLLQTFSQLPRIYISSFCDILNVVLTCSVSCCVSNKINGID